MSWSSSPPAQNFSDSTDFFRNVFQENGMTTVQAVFVSEPSMLDIYLGYTYFVLTAVTSVLSIIGCIVIILTYILIKVSETLQNKHNN